MHQLFHNTGITTTTDDDHNNENDNTIQERTNFKQIHLSGSFCGQRAQKDTLVLGTQKCNQ